MRRFEIAETVVDMTEQGGDCGGRHQVLAIILLCFLNQLLVCSWSEVRRNRIFINLRVLRQARVKGTQFSLIIVINGLSGENARILNSDI